MDRRREDRRWLAVCILLFFTAHLIVWGMEEAAYRAAEADKPPAESAWEAPLDRVLPDAVLTAAERRMKDGID